MKKFLAQLASNIVKNPDESSGFLLKILLVIGMFLVIISICALELIGSFGNGDKLLNNEFDASEEVLYKNIEAAYLEYEGEMQEKMNSREAELIAEHTEVIGKDEETGEEQTVCNISVTKQLTKINYAYAFAYINHKYPIKEGEKYKFDKEEIKEFFRNIAPFKELCIGTHYRLYTEVKTSQEVAEMYFTEDDDRQMYALSYDLYQSFLTFSEPNNADTDTGEGNQASPGNHFTYISPTEEETVINNCNDEIGKKVVEFAFSKLGYPYSQAQRDDGAHFDCSSLCFYAYKSVGITLMSGSANTAAAIANYCATRNQTVSFEQLQPGDLIFYCCTPGNGRFMGIDHVAIYAGAGKIIDASSSKGYVVYRNVFWKDRIVLCGRPR